MTVVNNFKNNPKFEKKFSYSYQDCSNALSRFFKEEKEEKEVNEEEKALLEAIAATKKLREAQNNYSLLRNEREKATFSMMMKMNPDALTNIRKEFFARQDSVDLNEFMYIIQKHLLSKGEGEGFVMETPEQREFGLNMYELFKDIDVNGDGQLEWQEFTSFTVEKANLLNKRAKLASIAHYHDSSSILDASSHYRHRHDISRFVDLPSMKSFAIVEDHKNSIFIFNSRLGKHTYTIPTDSAPIALEYIPDATHSNRELLVTSGADMTISTYSLDDPNPKKRFKPQASWSTPTVQMTLTYNDDNNILYSGGTDGKIYSWNINKRSMITTLDQAHTDIIMNLIMLKKLNNLATASLDKTLKIFDSYTNDCILTLEGHKKGVFGLSYNSDYRLIFSCGFEHDACVWSPFVKNLVYRLKGHHASLVGVHAIPDTPEIITADTSGVFKLWDIRNFQCVQTFTANLSGQDTKDSSKLTCFFHTKIASNNILQKEDDSRIYAASKMIFSFDQARVVHEATSDYTNIFWMEWNSDNSVIITASERNVIVWDAIIGSKLFTHNNICEDEISACCLDDRKRKVLIGDVKGKIGVYNYSNGALMKTVFQNNNSIVISLAYFNEGKRFLAGFSNGVISLYDENVLEDCHLIRCFESFNSHPELLSLNFDDRSMSVVTAGGCSNIVRIWDYSSGKCESELILGHSSSCIVVFAGVLKPYPIVITGDSLGNIILWGGKGLNCEGMRLSGFMNMTPASAQYVPEVLSNNHAYNEDQDDKPRKIVNASTFQELESMNSITDNHSQAHTTHNYHPKPYSLPAVRQRGLRIGINHLSAEARIDMNIKISSTKQTQKLYDESEKKWGKILSPQCYCWNPKTLQLFIGDEIGNLRCYDLTDLINDLGGDRINWEKMNDEKVKTMINTNKFTINGICRSKHRDSDSALPPLYEYIKDDPFEEAASHYLCSKFEDSMSYMGVKFLWSINSHNDRMIYCTYIPNHGILTSASDRLVKMWTFSGEFIGVLQQSVPVGVRSPSWEFDLDVERIVEKENQALDEIIKEAQIVASNPDNPDIKTLDFSGMQLGNDSADFSRSVLRQRIEKSSMILGLDFPSQSNDGKTAESKKALNEKYKLIRSPNKTQNNNDYYNNSLNQSNFQNTNIINNNNNDSNVQVNNNDISNNKQEDDDISIVSRKSLDDALKEIKSTEPAVDYETKNKHMTTLQQKRRATKLESISKHFEDKSGLKMSNSASFLDSPEKKNAENKENKDDDLASVTSTIYTESITTVSDKFDEPPKSISTNRRMSTMSNSINSNSLRKQSTLRAKLNESIKLAQENGPRTIAMINSCRKFSTYSALENAIASVNSGSPLRATRLKPLHEDKLDDDASVLTMDEDEPVLTEEIRAELRAERERKHSNLMNMVKSVRTTRLNSLINPPSIEEQFKLLSSFNPKRKKRTTFVVTTESDPTTSNIKTEVSNETEEVTEEPATNSLVIDTSLPDEEFGKPILQAIEEGSICSLDTKESLEIE